MNPAKPSKDKDSPGASSSSQVTFVSLMIKSNNNKIFFFPFFFFFVSRLGLNLLVKKKSVAVVSEPKL